MLQAAKECGLVHYALPAHPPPFFSTMIVDNGLGIFSRFPKKGCVIPHMWLQLRRHAGRKRERERERET